MGQRRDGHRSTGRWRPAMPATTTTAVGRKAPRHQQALQWTKGRRRGAAGRRSLGWVGWLVATLGGGPSVAIPPWEFAQLAAKRIASSPAGLRLPVRPNAFPKSFGCRPGGQTKTAIQSATCHGTAEGKHGSREASTEERSAVKSAADSSCNCPSWGKGIWRTTTVRHSGNCRQVSISQNEFKIANYFTIEVHCKNRFSILFFSYLFIYLNLSLRAFWRSNFHLNYEYPFIYLNLNLTRFLAEKRKRKTHWSFPWKLEHGNGR